MIGETMPPDLTLTQLRELMSGLNVRQLLLKELAPNDNSKNQPYLSGSLDVTNILPVKLVYADETPDGNRILKAPLALHWLQPDGSCTPAPHAKLILYPQYPEVRFSGFLLGSKNAPSGMMTTRMQGRLLFLGITHSREIVAWVAGPESKISEEIKKLTDLEQVGVFRKVPLQPENPSSRHQLLTALHRVHMASWIDSKSLKPDGTTVSCNSTNCVGYTLEAELGVSRNGRAEPDYLGWELKASQVPDYTRQNLSKVLTLFTPEPTGGFYRHAGVEAFVRKYGYRDKKGRSDRLNFGGVHRANTRHPVTGLTLVLHGFDTIKSKITDTEGAVRLITDTHEVAAEWSFPSVLRNWSRKHSQAVYVQAEARLNPDRQYRYSGDVRMGEGVNFIRFLAAIASGMVYYDPGINVKEESTAAPKIKKRSQFRTRVQDLEYLYDSFQTVSLQDY